MDQEFAVSDHSSLLRDPIRSGAEYVESLRGRNLTVYLMGDPVAEPVDHPIIRPSINAVAETYDLANNNPELASAMSPVTGERINRFLHIATNPADLVMQNKMQRRLGQLTGTCFQRCVGMDAIDTLHSVTFDIDRVRHRIPQAVPRLSSADAEVECRHRRRHDRSEGRPLQISAQQVDPDLFLRVMNRDARKVFLLVARKRIRPAA